MSPATLSTKRLRFERLCRENVPLAEYYELVGAEPNPTAEAELRYIPREPVETMGGAADRLDEFEEQWEARERAEYALRPREGEDGAGELAGTAGLVLAWDRSLAKLAVRLRKRFWGRLLGRARRRAAGARVRPTRSRLRRRPGPRGQRPLEARRREVR